MCSKPSVVGQPRGGISLFSVGAAFYLVAKVAISPQKDTSVYSIWSMVLHDAKGQAHVQQAHDELLRIARQTCPTPHVTPVHSGEQLRILFRAHVFFQPGLSWVKLDPAQLTSERKDFFSALIQRGQMRILARICCGAQFLFF